MKDLIREYRNSLKMLRITKVSPLYRNSMISDTEWAIELMETGHIPGTKWTVARWSHKKREVLCDPLVMARYVTNKEPVSAAPEWMVILLDKLMKSFTAREREAYELVRGQGYSFSQAGKLMGCSKGSVQNFVQRAEKKIELVVRKQTIYRDTFVDNGLQPQGGTPNHPYPQVNFGRN